MKAKNKRFIKRVVSFMLALVMVCGIVPVSSITASAATTTSVSLSSLGNKGTVKVGDKSKTGTWWQMNLNGKKAFCVDLGYTCHNGNTYEAKETHSWNQDTTGKNGCYAKVIRWYVLKKKRSTKGFVMSQALIWSISEGRTSEKQLKDIIKQVQDNIKISTGKTVDELYKEIFKPEGDWSADITFWQKTGNSKSYQKLMTVDAEDEPDVHNPKNISSNTYYRQRITVLKKDEDNKELGGIQFTLSAHNLDDLYSFAMTDRNGTETDTADDDNETSFSLTGLTTDDGRIAYRMTYKLETQQYYYYPDSELKEMSADDKKAAKKYLTDDMELDEGIDFASDLTKASAEKLMAKELQDLKDNISNTYTLTEDNVGDHADISLDPEFAKGVTITLTKDNSWEKNADNKWDDSLVSNPADYVKAYIAGVTNRYKKASVDVVKIDKYSKDKKPHGEAQLDGAEFQIYADAACSQKATVYEENGTAKTAGIYTVKNGKFVTDYLRSGVTYYLKEEKAPVGYTLTNDILPITVDATGATAEYTSDIVTVEYGNEPVRGKVAIVKYYSGGKTELLHPEANTTFQVYLTSKGSYDNCDEYERSMIKTDANGYGISGELYYGNYTVHQVDSGDVDAIHVKDFPVEVKANGEVKTYPINNELFKAYLRILKKDGNTEKTVLKSGTTYKIYRVKGDKEELVEQTYIDGNQKKTVDQFVTNETGEVMTVKELVSGTYRIYETDSATGLHISRKFIEVVINSKSNNYESWTDEDGYTHAVVTVTYTNEETYGKLKLYKTGEMLTGYSEGKFIYENRFLDGAVFLITAAEDIATQDNQGTHWYKKGDLVATLTTGKGVIFEKECKDITGYEIDDNGTVTVNLPLGKFHVEEVKTQHGFILPDKGWDIEFNWKNKDDEFVLNATDVTDKDGILCVENERAKAMVSLMKSDGEVKLPIEGAEFGVFTKHDIYNVDGEKIADAGTQLGTVTTDAEGKAISNLDLPLMSEGYEENKAENSGDYYLKELAVSGSYYLNETEYPIHLEYANQTTKVVAADVEAVNTPTKTVISKQAVAGSEELAGCKLQISDSEGNVIVNWTSGDKDSIVINDNAAAMGYRNLSADIDENGCLSINGLFHDTTYTLTETRPADGYVTADNISFQLVEGENSQTLVAIVMENEMVMQADNVVRMVDEVTHIRLIKIAGDTKERISGAKFEVYDKKGNKVLEFTSGKDGYDITGLLVVGETYTFKEVEAPKGYKLAKPVKYKIQDTSEVQEVSVTDKKITKPPVPQTGTTTPFAVATAILLILVCGGVFVFRRKKS